MRLALLILATAAVAACSSSRAPAEVPASEVATTQDFLNHLGTRGYLLRPAGRSIPTVLGVAGQVYEVDEGDYLAVFQFDSPEDAARGADAVTFDLLDGDNATLYRRGPILVAYGGGSAALQLTLTRALGPAIY